MMMHTWFWPALAGTLSGASYVTIPWLIDRRRPVDVASSLLSTPPQVSKDVAYLCQTVPHLVWVVSHDRQHNYCNRRTYDYLGIEGLTAGQWLGFLHEDDREAYNAQWASAIANKTDYAAEYRLRRHDGVHRWHLSRGTPIFRPDGSIEKWCGTCVDVHERKLLKSALNEVDARLQAVTTHASLILWGTDVSGHITYAVGQAMHRLGVQSSQVIGTSALTLFAAHKSIIEGLRMALSGQQSTAEHCVRNVYFEAFYAPQYDRNGKVVGAVALALDITERKQSETSYRDAQRLSEIVDAQHRVMSGPLDRDSIMHAILSAVAKLCTADGATLQLCEGEDIIMALAEGMAASVVGARTPVKGSIPGLAKTESATVVTGSLKSDPRFDSKGIERIPLNSMIATPIYGREGIIGVLTAGSKKPDAFDDLHIRTIEMFSNLLSTFWVQTHEFEAKQQVISSLEQARTNLIQARIDAEQGARLKSEFLANMSHEIRTPLNGIIGMTDLILETTLSDEQKRFARIVQESGTGLLGIINDILDYSKIEAGRFEIEKIPFSIKQVVSTQTQLLQSKALQSGLVLEDHVSPSIAAAVEGDPGRVAQVLVNIIGNAIKFSQSGSVTITVRNDKPEKDPASVRFEVTDTGIGIDPEVQIRLFQPFTQADGSTQRRFGGTGLGLSICKRLVELMGGTIGVESTLGRGSLFWFILPLQPVQKPAELAAVASMKLEPSLSIGAASADAAKTAAVNVGPKKILVADDNKVNLLLASKMLQSLGYTTQTADNGQEVLDALLKENYDLVLMDCQMPEMDGFAATKAIRQRELEQGGHIPIVALTANTFQEDIERCLSSGMDGFLGKPIRKDKLGDTLLKLFTQKS